VDEALQLVSTPMVSARLGEVFLHSHLSLDEDVHGDAGLAAINRLFSQRASEAPIHEFRYDSEG
jgi:hypothetical protein